MSLLPQRTVPVTHPEHSVRSEHLAQWRSAARRVARAWELWLKSEDSERAWAHDVYLDALDREEQAAALLEQDGRALHGG